MQQSLNLIVRMGIDVVDVEMGEVAMKPNIEKTEKVDTKHDEADNEEPKDILSYWYGLGPRPRAHLLQLAFFVLTCTAWLPWYYSTDKTPTETNLYPRDASFAEVFVEMDIQSIDPILLTTSVLITVTPLGNLSAALQTGEDADKDIILFPQSYVDRAATFLGLERRISGNEDVPIPITASLILFFSKLGYQEIHNATIVQDTVQTYTLDVNKSVTHYPMDKYSSTIYIKTYLKLYNVNTPDSTAYMPIACALQINNLVSGWVNKPVTSLTLRRRNDSSPITTDAGSIQVQMNFQRLTFVKGLSIFIVVVMWLISLAVFAMAFDNYFVQPVMKEISPPATNIANTTLFSLPALRLVQPGIPSINSYLYIDICGFYINMGIIAISVILMVSKIDWSQWQPKRAKAPVYKP